MKKHNKPVAEGDVFNLYITRKGQKGDGIGVIDKFCIIIPDSKMGEKVRVKITKVKNTYAYGRIINTEEV